MPEREVTVCSADEGQQARSSCPELRIFFSLSITWSNTFMGMIGHATCCNEIILCNFVAWITLCTCTLVEGQKYICVCVQLTIIQYKTQLHYIRVNIELCSFLPSLSLSLSLSRTGELLGSNVDFKVSFSSSSF